MDSTTAVGAAPEAIPEAKPAAKSVGNRNPLINRNYALLWSGQTISIIGDMMFTTTLVIWIATGLAAHQTWAPVAVSGVLLGAAAPTLLVGLFAGVFVDRAQKRPLMLWMDGLRTLIVASLVIASGAFPLPWLPAARLPLFWALGLIYAVVVLVNVGEQFFRPSSMALLQDIVPTEQQARAMGLSQVSISFALIIGPSLAAPLYAAFGPVWALLIDAASFAVSFLTILALRAPQHTRAAQTQRPSFWRELWAGFRYYFSNGVLVTLLVGVVVGVGGASALNTLDVFFATQNLHATTTMYGFMGGVYGVGAIVGSLLFALFAQRIGLARTLWLTMFIFGVLVVVLSRMTSYDIALGLFLVAGALNAGLNVAAGPMLLRETPNDMMGRVMSIFQPIMSLAVLVGTGAVGYLAGVTLRGLHVQALGMTFTPVDTLWLAGGVLMALSGLLMMVGLRGVDRRYRNQDRAAAAAVAAAAAAAAAAAGAEAAASTAASASTVLPEGIAL